MLHKPWVVGVAWLSLTMPALAQEREPGRAETSPSAVSEAPDVVVTGKRTSDRDIRDFVGILETAPGNRQIARFERRAVCPAAIGFSPTQRALVAARLRKVATAAHIPVAGTACRPNVVLMVTDDKPALMRFLAERSQRYFPNLSAAQIGTLVNDQAPASAWQLLGAPLNANGVEMQDDGNTGTYVNRTTNPGSRISAGARPQFSGAIVVIQASALAGLTTTQVADYAAMRAFARVDPTKLPASTLPTILTILDAPMTSEVPITLTRWDLGLLHSLYAGPVNVSAAAQRSSLSRDLAKEESSAEVRH